MSTRAASPSAQGGVISGEARMLRPPPMHAGTGKGAGEAAALRLSRASIKTAARCSRLHLRAHRRVQRSNAASSLARLSPQAARAAGEPPPTPRFTPSLSTSPEAAQQARHAKGRCRHVKAHVKPVRCHRAEACYRPYAHIPVLLNRIVYILKPRIFRPDAAVFTSSEEKRMARREVVF